MDSSFDISYDATPASTRYFDRSFDTSVDMSSREITVLESHFQNNEPYSSLPDRNNMSSYRTERTSEQHHGKPSPDRSLGLLRGHNGSDGLFVSTSFDNSDRPNIVVEKTVERSCEKQYYEAVKMAGVRLERIGVNHFHSVGPEVNSFDEARMNILQQNNDAMNKTQSSKRSIGMASQTQSIGSSSTMRDMLNKSQDKSPVEASLALEVVHITDRIISMTFPSEGHDTTYSFNLKEAARVLKAKHGDNFLILNLSEKHQDLVKAHPQVKEFGWPDHLAPPLERLCSLCKAMDTWLSADIRNVVVLHCKGGCSRMASIIAAYMHYNNICASAAQAVDSFAMKRYYDDKLGGLSLPSHQRYVSYFSGLLSGAIKINSNPLYLHHILIHGVPNFDSRGGCCPFIKVYQSMQPIFTSGVYNVTDNMQKVCISITPGIPLRGDILIKCYHKKTNSDQKEIIWQCQFHTCAITGNRVLFSKQELDDAVSDSRFPNTGKVEFVFGPSSDVLVSVSGFKSDVTVPVVDNQESLVRSDSYEDFNKDIDLPVDVVDFNQNGISSPQAPMNRTYAFQQAANIDHHMGPDGSLYATVVKRDPPSSSITSTNGQAHLTNGPIMSSLDSGYPGHFTSLNSHRTSTEATNTNISSNTTSSQVHQMNQNHPSLNRRTEKTVNERMQLDELLSNLLSDQVHVTPTHDSVQISVQSQQAQLSPSGTSGGLTVSPVMNSAKTVTTTTRTFTSYTSTDAHRNPDAVLIQRAEVSYKVPAQKEVNDHYAVVADVKDMTDAPSSKPIQPYQPKGVPSNAFSYTSGLSNSQRADFMEHEVIRSQPEQSVQSPVSPPLTYYPKFEPKMNTTSSTRTYSSVDGDTNSWLAQQQQKLKSFREGRDSSGHTEQEKKLVNELQFSQNKYFTHYDQTEIEEKALIDSYNRQQLHNGPTSPERITSSYASPQRSQSSQSSFAASNQWQDQFYNTSNNTSSYMESHSYGDRRSNKPPPSPTMQKSQPPTTTPLPVPVRTSSKEFMRTLSNSSSSNWQPPQQHRPLQRQHSETSYDRRDNMEPILPRSYGSTHNSPPHSPPQTITPSGPISRTTYTTYRTIEKQRETQDDIQRSMSVQQQQQQFLPPQPIPVQTNHNQQQQQQYLPPQQQYLPPQQQFQPPQQQFQPPQQQFQPPQPIPVQVNHNYVTEVFVHRSDQNRDKTDSTIRLNELEKNLEAVSQSIKSSQQQVVQQLPQQQVYEDSLRAHSSQQYNTYQETVSREESMSSLHRDERSMNPNRSHSPPIWDNVDGPEPIRVKEIEEDQIILRPIGPGMQTLEPESIHSGTLGRPSTPGFPTGPGAGNQNFNPPATIQFQQPQQTVQYQQYQSQQYQTQAILHDGQVQGTLHIDTSPKMIIDPQSPSGESPSSLDNINTLRQQISGSAANIGPQIVRGQSSPSVYYGLSRRGSLSSLSDSDMVHATPKFVKDTSKYWYKPNISREDAIQMLKDKQPGAFVIRDSNSFPGAYGLALKVATIPSNVQVKPSGDPQADLVRHFLIEPTPKGVRLRGCSNEPVFGSLAALVYQHSVTPLALPWKLSLPEPDTVDPHFSELSVNTPDVNSASTLLGQGAACNVIYINSVDLESLTGPQAITKAVKMTYENLVPGRTTVVHFKVFNDGITLTDNNRKLFFRRHYPVSAVTYCGMDPQDRRWKREIDAPGVQGDARLFGFVARKQGTSNENTCHIFAELDPEQPASAIVNFVTKVMIGQSKLKS